MRVVIVYGTRHSQTTKVAQHMAERLRQAGHTVDVKNLSRNQDPEPCVAQCDLVILGGPIYIGRLPKEVRLWAQRHRQILGGRRSALFTLGFNAADTRPLARADDDKVVQNFLRESGWIPEHVACFAGSLNYTQYSWPVKKMMKRISRENNGPQDLSQDHELTRWQQVDDFVAATCDSLSKTAYSYESRFADRYSFDRMMPVFEQGWQSHKEVDAPATSIYMAIALTQPADLKIIKCLDSLRIGSAQAIEVASLVEHPPYEKIVGFVGRSRKLEIGTRKVDPGEFMRFSEPGYAKVIVRFKVEELGPQRSLLTCEARVHGINDQDRRRLRNYGLLLVPAVRLSLKSLLTAIAAKARTTSDNSRQTA